MRNIIRVGNGYFVPTSDGWADGDRGIICCAAKVDGTTTTGSIKK